MPDTKYNVRVSDEAGHILDRVWVHPAPACVLDVEDPSDQEVINYMKKIGSSHSEELLAAALVSTDRLHAAPCKDIAFTSKAVWYVLLKAFVIYSRISCYQTLCQTLLSEAASLDKAYLHDFSIHQIKRYCGRTQ